VQLYVELKFHWKFITSVKKIATFFPASFLTPDAMLLECTFAIGCCAPCLISLATSSYMMEISPQIAQFITSVF